MDDRLRFFDPRLLLLAGALLAAIGCAAQPPATESPYFDLLSHEVASAPPLVVATPFGGAGEVTIEAGQVRIAMGSPLSGIHVPSFPAHTDYELEVIAARSVGNDFFCGLTFPVGESHLTLVVGGWGGALCGLSTLDGADASQNETKSFHRFERNRPYEIRVVVRGDRVIATLDGTPLVDAALAGRQLSVRPEVMSSRPLGIATYNTTATITRFQWRGLPAPEESIQPR